jgi:hypothetical protein
MANGWDSGKCNDCPHFKSSVTPKGYKWSCALNRKSMHEIWEFYMIWAEDHLISRGKLIENARSKVFVDYIGK